MSYTNDNPNGHCRRCAWLRDAINGHILPLPEEDGEPLEFEFYPPIGPVITLS